jgi:hypothetical protein
MRGTLPCSDLLPTSSTRAKSLTLSSVRLMLQDKPLQRRRHEVQRQGSLWHEEKQNIWEELDLETQQKVIALVSKMIEKAVRPRDERESDTPERG